ncbi:predicted protein [Histoplasma capsulatum var. duboisii H88]|uniref:Predicted protein n=1 Tax=Ajellomyces capsulatus (strain H88) TaxID=544711 RepID=F0UJW1_AJEC8|nr:predicted protein [Histoplasma capsulatum var. duboisii H88]
MSTYMWFRIVTLLIIQSRQQERQQQQRQRQHYGDASLYNSAGEYAHTCTHLPQCYRADPDKDGSRSATGTCHGKPFCHKWAAHQLYGIEPILGTMRQCPASTFFTCLVCECDYIDYHNRRLVGQQLSAARLFIDLVGYRAGADEKGGEVDRKRNMIDRAGRKDHTSNSSHT